MGAPYNLPGDLRRLPLGIAWKSIGQPAGTTPSDQQNQAQLLDVCQIATGLANDEIDQDVRSNLVSEELYFTSHWASALPSGGARLMVRFNPVVDVPFFAVSPASQPYPKSWVVAPPGNAWAERRAPGVYGVSQPSGVSGGMNSIVTAAGFPAGWWGGGGYARGQLQMAVNFSHGWPHAAITTVATQGATSLVVDEVCGFLGAAAMISDGQYDEYVQVTSITQATPAAYSASAAYFPGMMVTNAGTTYQCTMANGPGSLSGVQAPGASGSSVSPYWTTTLYPVGPGTLNLAKPTQYAHNNLPTLVTSMPRGVRWGMALYTVRIILERGLGTVSAPGRDGKTVSNGQAIEEATINAVAALRPFARVV